MGIMIGDLGKTGSIVLNKPSNHDMLRDQAYKSWKVGFFLTIGQKYFNEIHKAYLINKLILS